MTEDITFRARRIAAQAVLEAGICVSTDRFVLEQYQAVITIMTLEEPVAKIPADWWQHLKQRWFPRWLLKRFPVKQQEIIAVHKFPELDVPVQVLGREFVHLKIVDSDELGKKEKKE